MPTRSPSCATSGTCERSPVAGGGSGEIRQPYTQAGPRRPGHSPQPREVAGARYSARAQRVQGLAADRLETLYVLATWTAMREGELLGLCWEDVDLDDGKLYVRHQLQRMGGQFVLTEPKSESSRRTLMLPLPVSAVLTAYRRSQDAERATARIWLNEWGLAFTGAHGEPLGRRPCCVRSTDTCRRPACPRSDSMTS